MSEPLPVTAAPLTIDHETLPPLVADRAFWGMSITQFLGAFNDNLFKQLILLLSIAALPDGDASDNQGVAMFVFAAPFLAFTGYAGYLSDKLGKRGIVIACKVAEIAVMALGGAAFWLYGGGASIWFLYAVLFLMGAQSAFFGPAKYGILPEMLRPRDLPGANGFMMMTTFLAIIFGTVVAGFLLKFFGDRLSVATGACVTIAVAGTLSSLLVRKVPPANPELKFEPSALAVPPDMRQLLWEDGPLAAALLVSSVFWLLAGMVPSAVNALGKLELVIGDDWTSVMAGVIGVGIALGCVLGGIVSRGQVNFRLIRVGSLGMLACLLVLAISASGDPLTYHDADGGLTHLPGLGEGPHWLGFWGSLPTLLLLGMFTGLFAVPLQVFMQSRPPSDKKGRMIAVMNQANWVGILISAMLYQGLARLIEWQDWPRCTMFLFIAALMLPIVMFYHPKNEVLGDS
jgi:acyl-[acyl-carrier-protein]-phospholipid O-acyltransferase/long-chain-fatty-acid--[acyl-carrier-protein] ligase